ncbi:MAG: hypothetical protein Pars2KO_09940 [Parasphingorhabdus sp.]
MNNNRQQRGRGRGRNNNNNRNNNRGGGGIDRDNRIDNRARGNAAQMLDKYKKMAHDAQVNDDRVNAEYYLQFADHYFRVNADMQARREEQRIAREEQRAANGHDRDDNRGNESARDNEGDENDNRRGRPQRSRPQRDERSDRNDRDDQPAEASEEKKPVRARRPRKVENDKVADKAPNGDASDNTEEPKGLDAGVLPPAISISSDSDADEVKVEKKPARKKRVVKPKAVVAKAEEGDAA